MIHILTVIAVANIDCRLDLIGELYLLGREQVSKFLAHIIISKGGNGGKQKRGKRAVVIQAIAISDICFRVALKSVRKLGKDGQSVIFACITKKGSDCF